MSHIICFKHYYYLTVDAPKSPTRLRTSQSADALLAARIHTRIQNQSSPSKLHHSLTTFHTTRSLSGGLNNLLPAVSGSSSNTSIDASEVCSSSVNGQSKIPKFDIGDFPEDVAIPIAGDSGPPSPRHPSPIHDSETAFIWPTFATPIETAQPEYELLVHGMITPVLPQSDTDGLNHDHFPSISHSDNSY